MYWASNFLNQCHMSLGPSLSRFDSKSNLKWFISSPRIYCYEFFSFHSAGIVPSVSLFDVVWGYSYLLAEEILNSSSFLRELGSGHLTERCYSHFIQQEALYLHRVSSTLQVRGHYFSDFVRFFFWIHMSGCHHICRLAQLAVLRLCNQEDLWKAALIPPIPHVFKKREPTQWGPEHRQTQPNWTQVTLECGWPKWSWTERK